MVMLLGFLGDGEDETCRCAMLCLFFLFCFGGSSFAEAEGRGIQDAWSVLGVGRNLMRRESR